MEAMQSKGRRETYRPDRRLDLGDDDSCRSMAAGSRGCPLAAAAGGGVSLTDRRSCSPLALRERMDPTLYLHPLVFRANSPVLDFGPSESAGVRFGEAGPLAVACGEIFTCGAAAALLLPLASTDPSRACGVALDSSSEKETFGGDSAFKGGVGDSLAVSPSRGRSEGVTISGGGFWGVEAEATAAESTKGSAASDVAWGATVGAIAGCGGGWSAVASGSTGFSTSDEGSS
jgi:hypothetical protein